MSNSGIDQLQSRMAMVPVTTMEQVVLPTEAEQEAMRASLKAAEADIAAGNYAEHDPQTFVDRLTALRDSVARANRS